LLRLLAPKSAWDSFLSALAEEAEDKEDEEEEEEEEEGEEEGEGEEEEAKDAPAGAETGAFGLLFLEIFPFPGAFGLLSLRSWHFFLFQHHWKLLLN